MGDAPPEERYFVRAGYVANPPRTAVPGQDYWNARRIETSALFQYSVYKRARALARSYPGARVLDLGCGTARKAAELLIPHCAYYCGLDQRSAIEYCARTISARNAEFRVDDLETPGERFERLFNVIVCADVIEHLASPNRLIAYAIGCLSLAGRLVISTPERDVMRGSDATDSPNPEHVREWNREELRAYLVSRGLRVDSLRLAPQFRMSFSEAGVRLVRGQLRDVRAYWGCQVAICART